METKMPNLEIPEKMREFADRTVEQARKLSDGYFSVARQASDRLNGASVPAPEGAGELVRKCLEYAEQNANAGFSYRASLPRFRNKPRRSEPVLQNRWLTQVPNARSESSQ